MKVQLLIFSLFMATAISGISQNNDLTKTIRIHGISLQHSPGDTFTVRIWKHIFGREDYSPYSEYKSPVNAKGEFEFLIKDVDELSFLSMGRDKTPSSRQLIEFLQTFVCAPGDDIHISIGKIYPATIYSVKPDSTLMHEKTILKSIAFTGKGAKKYEVQTAIRARRLIIRDSIFGISNKKWYLPWIKEDSLEYRQHYMQSIARLREGTIHDIFLLDSIELRLLNEYQFSISRKVYNLIKAEVIGRNEYTYSEAYLFAFAINKFITPMFRDSIRSELRKVANARILPFNPSSISDHAKSKSYWYIKYLKDDALIRSNYNYDSAFVLLMRNYKGQLKEKALTSFLSEVYNVTRMAKATIFLDSAISIVKTKDFQQVLFKVRETQLNGTKAYDFTLPDINGKLVQLSNFKGKVIFLDFWFTGCTGCKLFFTSDVQVAEKYFAGNPNVVFITICADRDYNDWKHSLQQGGYTSDGAVNLYTAGRGFDNPVMEKYMVQGAPRPIIIGKDGNIFCNDTKKMKMFSDGAALIDLLKDAIKE